MARFDYFSALSELSDIMENEVALAFDGNGYKSSDMVAAGRKKAARLCADTQKALWGDMIPPLERGDIAAVLNSIVRVINTAAELRAERTRVFARVFSPPLRASRGNNGGGRGEIYTAMAREIGGAVSLLGDLRHMKEPPPRVIYDLAPRLSEAEPTSHGDRAANLERKLGDELFLCYDRLVEAMYNNL